MIVLFGKTFFQVEALCSTFERLCPYYLLCWFFQSKTTESSFFKEKRGKVHGVFPSGQMMARKSIHLFFARPVMLFSR